ncbi:hypothetical protein P9139_16275 [Curtobacterium flaccumfaciens]|nr:hypothetical protein P9139_16275 [Curtobacterium flaccumfaciens]
MVALLRAARSYVVDGNAQAAIVLTERALHIGGGSEDEHVALLGVAEALLANRLLGFAARYLAAIRPFRAMSDETRRLRLEYSVQYLSGDAVHADELLVPVDPEDAAEADAVGGLLAMVACFRAEAWELDHARDLLARAEPLRRSASPHTVEITTAARELVAAVDGTLPPDTELHDGLSTATLLGMSDPALLLLAHALSIAERYRSARRVFALVLARGPEALPVWTEAARYLSAENEVRSGNFRQALRAIDVWEAGSSVVERLREPSRAIAIAWRHFAEGRSPRRSRSSTGAWPNAPRSACGARRRSCTPCAAGYCCSTAGSTRLRRPSRPPTPSVGPSGTRRCCGTSATWWRRTRASAGWTTPVRSRRGSRATTTPGRRDGGARPGTVPGARRGRHHP